MIDFGKPKKSRKSKAKKEGTQPNEPIAKQVNLNKDEVFKSKYNIDAILKDIENRAKQGKNKQFTGNKTGTFDPLRELRTILLDVIVNQRSLIDLLIFKHCIHPTELGLLVQKNYEILDRLNRTFREDNNGKQ